ncbi:retinoic acid receptor responder protein 2 [Mixophyes fleayi]|uniref:retinoic acid receptor responder protein 2 n=1 Tax=Mixophyes fleayi TaxID=3061075 RepID=UPI003F4D7616
MKTAARTWWIISVLLVLAAEGDVPLDKLTEIQNKAVRLVMENFHNKDNLKNGFKLSSVLEAGQIEYGSGIFVNLEFTIQQTTCQKHQWTQSDCEFTRNKIKFNCFSCFKFDYEDEVQSQVIDCARPHFVKDRVAQRKKTCREVEMKNAGKIIGSYSFLKSQ